VLDEGTIGGICIAGFTSTAGVGNRSGSLETGGGTGIGGFGGAGGGADETNLGSVGGVGGFGGAAGATGGLTIPGGFGGATEVDGAVFELIPPSLKNESCSAADNPSINIF
jgi:hypothetical protein